MLNDSPIVPKFQNSFEMLRRDAKIQRLVGWLRAVEARPEDVEALVDADWRLIAKCGAHCESPSALTRQLVIAQMWADFGREVAACD